MNLAPAAPMPQQYEDIAQGKALLQETFAELLTPAFTPPWNRYTADTLRALDDLGFAVFSGLRPVVLPQSYGFQALSVSLDLYQWKGGATMKAPSTLVADLITQIQQGESIGLLLHHKVMDTAAFTFLDTLLAELRRYSFMRFHSFTTLQKSSVVSEKSVPADSG